jgi:drug/metabolite transporter (DMT)-like permease
MNNQTKGLLITTLGVLFVIPDALFVRIIEADTLTISFWRNFLTGAFTLVGLFFIYGTKTPQKIVNTGKYGLIYAGFTGFSSILFVSAVANTSVANVVFIIASMPIFAAIVSWFWLGERISKRMVWTIILVALGLSVIAFGSGSNPKAHWTGDVMALGIASSFAVGLTAARKAKAISMVPAIPIAYIGAALAVLPFTSPMDIIPSQWGLVVLHGGFFILISTTFLALGPRYIPSAEVALLILLESVLSPLLVWYFIGEEPGNWALLGGAIVISVLFVSNLIVLMRKRPAKS